MLNLAIKQQCPKCGTDLRQERKRTGERNTNSIEITDTKGDVIGVGISGIGNIVGKNVEYEVKGNVLNLNINNVTKEILEHLEKTIAVQTSLSLSMTPYKERIINAESRNENQEIRCVLEDIDRIEKKEGVEIERIRAENIQISINELVSKEYLLKGNGYLYRQKYSEAILWYDKAIEVNLNNAEPNYVDAYNNK